jgi:hypothetical protein
MAQDYEKAQLIAELARARADVSTNIGALRHDLDFPTRAKKSFTSSPMPWLGGAALIGLIISRIPGRTKKVVRISPKQPQDSPVEKAGKAGLLLGALKIAFDFARPTLLKWATQRFSDYVASAQTHDSYKR